MTISNTVFKSLLVAPAMVVASLFSGSEAIAQEFVPVDSLAQPSTNSRDGCDGSGHIRIPAI